MLRAAEPIGTDLIWCPIGYHDTCYLVVSHSTTALEGGIYNHHFPVEGK